MGVEDVERRATVSQPVAAERFAAATQQRVVANLAPRHAPVLRARVPRQRYEPPVEVAAGRRGFGRERVRRTAHELDWIAGAGECCRKDGHAQDRQTNRIRTAPPRRDSDSTLERREQGDCRCLKRG